MMADGTDGGPCDYDCKGSSDKILQCLLFESTAPKAPLVAVEYFIAKDLTCTLPAIQGHRYFHDHKVEVATGRVQILDVPAHKAAKLAEAAAETDGVLYQLWQPGQEVPDAAVRAVFPRVWSHGCSWANLLQPTVTR